MMENPYHHQLTREQLLAGQHRNAVGGMWDVIGPLQFEFLKSVGLKPEHRLADIGCGSLRGGIHFIRYLNRGNYYGLDINQSLIDGGTMELATAGLSDKSPALLVDDGFRLSKFCAKFDYAVAISLFTHLFMNHIVRCLAEVKASLREGGEFYSTYFEAPHSGHVRAIRHTPGNMVTNLDADPFHYSFAEMSAAATSVGLAIQRIGEWDHPRSQKMLLFS